MTLPSSRGFNPYRVFEYVATSSTAASVSSTHMVSIPIGFSSTLQQDFGELSDIRMIGFNPYRVFEYVATGGNASLFLSLLLVSIPIGFSSTLQRSTFFRVRRRHAVSIPIGFSSTLQRCWLPWHPRRSSGFNPYRVFEYVATMPPETCTRQSYSFNPYRVFEYVATSTPLILSKPIRWVSIPIGFSSTLQRRWYPCRDGCAV